MIPTPVTCLPRREPQVAVTGGADSSVRVWDARTGDKVRSLIVEGKEVLCVRPWPGDPYRFVFFCEAEPMLAPHALRFGPRKGLL